jgi:hypothetical protein
MEQRTSAWPLLSGDGPHVHGGPRLLSSSTEAAVTPLMMSPKTSALMGPSLVEFIINLISVATASTHKMLDSLERRSPPGYRIASSRR